MSRDRLIRRHLRDRFLVTMTNGEGFEGLVDEVDDKHVVLVDADVVSASERTKVDGRLWLPRSGIAYMQQPKA